MIGIWIENSFIKVLYIIKTIYHKCTYPLISVSNSWNKIYEISK